MAQIGKAATRDARSARPGAAQMTQFLEALAESSNVAASARAAGVALSLSKGASRRSASFDCLAGAQDRLRQAQGYGVWVRRKQNDAGKFYCGA